MAQSRYYLQTFDPEVGTICILGALGHVYMELRVGVGSAVCVFPRCAWLWCGLAWLGAEPTEEN